MGQIKIQGVRLIQTNNKYFITSLLRICKATVFLKDWK